MYDEGWNFAIHNSTRPHSDSQLLVQHGSFGSLGSDRDSYYANGSDDFRTYLWKVPEEAALREARSVVDYSDWTKNRRPGEIGESGLCAA